MPDPIDLRETTETATLAKEAHPVQLVGALLLSGAVVTLAAFVTFGYCEVQATLLSVALFAAGVAAYALVGWTVTQGTARDQLLLFSNLGCLFPFLRAAANLWFLWLLLYPGRLMALAAVGVRRFVRARRRLCELRGRIPSVSRTRGPDI